MPQKCVLLPKIAEFLWDAELFPYQSVPPDSASSKSRSSYSYQNDLPTGLRLFMLTRLYISWDRAPTISNACGNNVSWSDYPIMNNATVNNTDERATVNSRLPFY